MIPFSSTRVTRLHTHDFPEVFWIESGSGLHEINGERRRLDTGDLVIVRPADCHRLEAVDERGFSLVNLAYSPLIRADLLNRHRHELGALLDPLEKLPCRVRMTGPMLATLRRRVVMLSNSPRSRVSVESFLLGLQEYCRLEKEPMLPPMPDWLRHAMMSAKRPEVFARGVPALVKASGRSAEHVARTLKAVLGMTPTDYLNQIRMEFAARELRVTERPIVDIALDCGLGNLSYFYALFREAHGMAPRAYRFAHYNTIV